MCPMGKTVQVAADRAYDQSRTVLPAEVARGTYMQNPPGLAALKLMHLLIAKAGGRMGEDVEHRVRLSEVRGVEGLRNHDRASLAPLFAELQAAVLIHDDTEKKRLTIGGLLDIAEVDYRDELSGDLVISWYFSRMFTRAAAASNHWAILDRQTVFHLGSKYSLLLFQHIASLAGMDRIDAKTFTIPELRTLLAVPEGKLERFADLNRRALQQAIAEINQLSRLTLTATPRKIGRTVASIEIAWTVKEDPTPAKRELSVSKVGRKARRDGTAETLAPEFPETGGIAYSPHWRDLKRTAGCTMDDSLIATNFRRFLKERGIARNAANIEKLFSDFCAKVGRV